MTEEFLLRGWEDDVTLKDLVSWCVFLWRGHLLPYPEMEESPTCSWLTRTQSKIKQLLKSGLFLCCVHFPNVKISSSVSSTLLMTKKKMYLVYQGRPASHWSSSKVWYLIHIFCSSYFDSASRSREKNNQTEQCAGKVTLRYWFFWNGGLKHKDHVYPTTVSCLHCLFLNSKHAWR